MAPSRRQALLRSNPGTNSPLTTDVLAGGRIVRVRIGAVRQRIRPQGQQPMDSRVTQTVVSFASAFSLPGFDEQQPPGEYRVDREEQPIEIGSHLAWLRVNTFIHLPAIAKPGLKRQMVPIDPVLLEAALEQDRRQS
jgi:hypothetical protein